MISIIVPVYNSEKYLDQCIQSILAQTYTDFELLLIDDGSTDSSSAICDRYAEQDSRVRVFHKENGGVSSARNLGLDNAKGEWVTFIDSDDLVKSDYLKSMIEQADADLIMSSFEFIGKIEDWDNSISDKLYHKEEIKDFLERYIWGVALCGAVCKLFQKSKIGGTRFNEKIASKEDTIFVFEYLQSVSTIRTIENYGYQYRRGLDDSLSIKSLPTEQCLYIIHHYSSHFKKLEAVFGYYGNMVRIANNCVMMNRSFGVFKMSNISIKRRYNDFVNFINDDSIREIIQYKDNNLKGVRRRFFDFLAVNKLYIILFIYVISYKGCVY